MTADVSSETILLIEDDRDVRAALAVVLADEGFQVLTAPNGFDALAAIESHERDVIILDWRMTGVDDAKIVRALRSEYNLTIPVLVITAGRVNQEEALSAGADDYLEKPFDLNELVDRVRALAGRGGRRQ